MADFSLKSATVESGAYAYPRATETANQEVVNFGHWGPWRNPAVGERRRIYVTSVVRIKMRIIRKIPTRWRVGIRITIFVLLDLIVLRRVYIQVQQARTC